SNHIKHYKVPYVDPTEVGASQSLVGGHYQFAFGYNGKGFVVSHEVLNRCFFENLDYDPSNSARTKVSPSSNRVPISTDMPLEQDILGWSRTAALSIRESYMNYANTTRLSNQATASTLRPGLTKLVKKKYDHGVELYIITP
ncbi:hypothetical protein EV182_004543, partial [Spiromyces aspiralis]